MTDNRALTVSPSGATALEVAQAHDWESAARDWLDNLGSDRTREVYLDGWRDFLAFAQVAPDRVTQSHVIAYRRYLETTPSPRTGRPYAQATINLHLSALGSFFRFAKDKGLRADNPTDEVKRRAVDPYGKATWLEPKEGQDLKLLSVIDTSTPQGLRDRAIVLLFLTYGLRVSEVAGLKVGQLRRQADTVFLTYTRKRGKTKTVKLPPETAQAIQDYLATRGPLTDASPIFTATDEGRRAARRMLAAKGQDLAEGEKTLTPRAIAYLVKTYCDRAFGPGHGIHPHSLRHTAAKAAEFLGATTTELGDLLGHASARVTTIYMHATKGAADEVAARLGGRYAQAATETKKGA